MTNCTRCQPIRRDRQWRLEPDHRRRIDRRDVLHLYRHGDELRRNRACIRTLECRDPGRLPGTLEVVTESHTDKQSSLLVRTNGPVLDPAWAVTPVSLEDLVLAYMSRAGDETPARRQHLGVVS